jgi:hypothetical protein
MRSMRSMRGGFIFRSRGPSLKVHHGQCLTSMTKLQHREQAKALCMNAQPTEPSLVYLIADGVTLSTVQGTYVDLKDTYE